MRVRVLGAVVPRIIQIEPSPASPVISFRQQALFYNVLQKSARSIEIKAYRGSPTVFRLV